MNAHRCDQKESYVIRDEMSCAVILAKWNRIVVCQKNSPIQ